MPNQTRAAYTSIGSRASEKKTEICWTRRFTPEHSITCTRHYQYTNNTYNGCYEISIEAESQTHTYIYFDRDEAKFHFDAIAKKYEIIYRGHW